MTSESQKSETVVTAERVLQHLQSRFNPIRGLTPERLASRLDAFDRGYLRDAAMLWQKIRDRDDQVITVTQKRDLTASMLNWEITALDESPRALEHKQALEDFYNNLVATNAIDASDRGGVSKLIGQMMHAVGHKYAVHEIVWNPSDGGLTAEFRFTPLQFFENTTGKLRFLQTEFATFGVDLEDGGWMVTRGPGIMEATSIAYMFKQMPLKDWVIFCGKAGMPGLHGKTDAAKGSAEWDALKDALTQFGNDWAMVTSLGASVDTVDLKSGGELPYPPLVDRMDRAIAKIWRGADLSTMSSKQAIGANPQDDETQIFEQADALLISETLQYYVDRMVIQYRFGEKPLAYFQLHPHDTANVEMELKIDSALIGWGVAVAKNDLLARYGRPLPKEGEELATAPVQPAVPGAPLGNEVAGRRGRALVFDAAAVAALEPKIRETITPLAERLQKIAGMGDPVVQRTALKEFKADLPQLYQAAVAKIPESAAAWEKILGTAFLSGFSDAAKAKLS